MMSLRFGPLSVRDAIILLFIALFFIMSRAEIANAQSANGPVIFDVRRSLPLEADEEVTKDFYINAGPEAGFKKGVYIAVVRPIPVHDPIKNVQQATLNIPVGKLKVIEVQRGITVARLESELTDDDRPTLEFEGIMVGDRIDLGSITTEAPKKPKPKAKKHLARNDGDEPNPGSAEAMAARNLAPAPETPVQPKEVEMTTGADVKPDASAQAAPATNNSQAPRAPAESAPKKSQAPKSVENEDDSYERNSYPAPRAADNLRVADYTY